MLRNWGIGEREYYRVSEEIINVLEEDGKTLREIMHALPAKLKRRVQRIVGRRKYSASNVSVILSILEVDGKIISLKSKGA